MLPSLRAPCKICPPVGAAWSTHAWPDLYAVNEAHFALLTLKGQRSKVKDQGHGQKNREYAEIVPHRFLECPVLGACSYLVVLVLCGAHFLVLILFQSW